MQKIHWGFFNVIGGLKTFCQKGHVLEKEDYSHPKQKGIKYVEASLASTTASSILELR